MNLNLKRKLIFTFLLLMVGNASVLAQGTILFCDSVTSEGKPVNVFESLLLNPEGQTISVLYQRQLAILFSPQIRMEVAKLEKSVFKKFDTRSIFCEPTKLFLVIPYTIRKSGDYRFRLYDHSGVLLAEEILSVSESMQEVDGTRETSAVPLAADSLAVPQLLFAEGLPGQGYSFNTEFPFRSTHGRLLVLIEPFNPENPKRLLDIWKKEGSLYSKYVSTEAKTFAKDGTYGYTDVILPGAGAYKLNLYSDQNVLITSGFVELK